MPRPDDERKAEEYRRAHPKAHKTNWYVILPIILIVAACIIFIILRFY